MLNMLNPHKITSTISQFTDVQQQFCADLPLRNPDRNDLRHLARNSKLMNNIDDLIDWFIHR